MKDRYNELFSIVCKKGDERLEQRRIVWTKIRNVSAAISGICATIIIGAGIWNSTVLRNALNNEYDPPVIIEIPSTTQTDPALTSKNTEPCASEAFIKKTTSPIFDSQTLTSHKSKVINVDPVASSTTTSVSSDEKK